jgi:hypothetical protein
MSMGKGLEAILKGPGKRKDEERVATDGVVTDAVDTGKVTIDRIATGKGSAEEAPADEVVTSELSTAKLEDKSTPELTTDVVATESVITGAVAIKQDVIAKAISDAKRSPRISTWSPVAMGTLKVLWMTQPQFSMSNEIRMLIEEGLAKKYPELVEMVKKELNQGD